MRSLGRRRKAQAARIMSTPNSIEQQAIAIFQQAAEERRFLRSHRWTITYYAMTAYGVLAVAPSFVEPGGLRTFISLLALPLVLAAGFQAYRLLADVQDELNMEKDRLLATLTAIRYIWQIHDTNRLYKDRSPQKSKDRYYPSLCEWRVAGWVSFFVLLLAGGFLAIVIILSRIHVRSHLPPGYSGEPPPLKLLGSRYRESSQAPP
jgi:hypothetical protein